MQGYCCESAILESDVRQYKKIAGGRREERGGRREEGGGGRREERGERREVGGERRGERRGGIKG